MNLFNGCYLILVIGNGAQKAGEGRHQLALKVSERESKVNILNVVNKGGARRY